MAKKKAEQEIEEKALFKAAKMFEEKTKNDFEILQHDAEVFISEVDKIRNAYKIALEKGKYAHLKDKTATIYQAMRADTAFTQKALKSQHKFENKLNSFLNRTVFLSYVLPDGTVLIGNESTIAKIYKMATAQRGRGNISESKINEELFKSRDAAFLSLQSDYQQAANERKAVYTEALVRYKAQGDKAPSYKKNSSLTKTYWWYVKGRQEPKPFGWTENINNIGDIAEGYVEAIVDEDNRIKNENLEEGLEALWRYHIRRNNTPAIIREDVSVINDNGDIQFAVKSGSFSTASIGQYYRFATNIKELKFLTAEDLKNDAVFKSLISGGDKAKKVVDMLKEKYSTEIVEKLTEKPLT